MKPEEIKEVAKEMLRLQRPEVFEQAPKPLSRDDDALLERLAQMLVEHRPPCHDLSKDDLHCLKSIIKDKLKLAKTKTVIKVTVVGLVIREAWLLLKENVHWGP